MEDLLDVKEFILVGYGIVPRKDETSSNETEGDNQRETGGTLGQQDDRFLLLDEAAPEHFNLVRPNLF